jgi:hypothetical protein
MWRLLIVSHIFFNKMKTIYMLLILGLYCEGTNKSKRMMPPFSIAPLSINLNIYHATNVQQNEVQKSILCFVCLSELKTDNTIRSTCGHFYHYEW